MCVLNLFLIWRSPAKPKFLLVILSALWESLLKTRIELQKATSRANQLPQPEAVQGFMSIGGQEYVAAMKQGKLIFVVMQHMKF